jgi:hypothetical protein
VIAGFGTASGMRVAHNLILLCQWHHTAVHEGGMTIRKTEDGASWQFVMPDGGPHMPWYTGDTLPNLLRFQLGKQRASLAKITSMQDPPATTIPPAALGRRAVPSPRMCPGPFRIKLPDQDQQAA